MESNVRYVASLTCIERFLNRSDELHLLGHGIKAMTPKSCYNISFVETASEKPQYNQLWQTACHVFTILFRIL